MHAQHTSDRAENDAVTGEKERLELTLQQAEVEFDAVRCEQSASALGRGIHHFVLSVSMRWAIRRWHAVWQILAEQEGMVRREADLERLSVDLESRKARTDNMDTLIDAAEAEVEKSRSKIDTQRVQVERLQRADRDRDRLDREVRMMKQESDKQKAKIEDLESRNVKLSDKLRGGDQSQCAKLKDQVTSLKAERDILKERLKSNDKFKPASGSQAGGSAVAGSASNTPSKSLLSNKPPSLHLTPDSNRNAGGASAGGRASARASGGSAVSTSRGDNDGGGGGSSSRRSQSARGGRATEKSQSSSVGAAGIAGTESRLIQPARFKASTRKQAFFTFTTGSRNGVRLRQLQALLTWHAATLHISATTSMVRTDVDRCLNCSRCRLGFTEAPWPAAAP